MASQAETSGSITTTPTSDATVVHLAGEIDGARRDEASRALSTSLRRQLPVVLDTSEVTFIDSTGLAFLIQCGSVGRSQGISVSLRRPPAEVSDLLAVLGAETLFDDAARADVGRARPPRNDVTGPVPAPSRPPAGTREPR